MIIARRKYFLMLLLIVAGSFAGAQLPQWQWVQNGGGGGYQNSTPSNPGGDLVYDETFDTEGNLIVGGYCSWTPIFDTVSFPNIYGSPAWQGTTFFLAKYDNCGNLLWVRAGGGAGTDAIGCVQADEDGNIYTFGSLSAYGLPAYINTPLKDTIIPANAMARGFFAKWDKNGNLLYVRTYPNLDGSNWGVMARQFKRLKSGDFVGIIDNSGSNSVSPVNILGYSVPNNAYAMVIMDTLGSIKKLTVIDTFANYATIGDMILTENEDIIFPCSIVNPPAINILGNSYPVGDYRIFLVKTDTSFQVKKINYSGNADALYYLSYSKGYLYASGRNGTGSFYDSDTTHYNYQYTLYKIDTANLHLVWSSKVTPTLYEPQWTYFVNGASKDYVYTAFQNRGVVIWDSVSLSTPANTADVAILRFRTSDGVCVSGEFAAGNIAFNDEIQRVKIGPGGNPYLIGTFGRSIGTYNDSVFANGQSLSPDYFILKWGLPCGDSLNSLDSPLPADNLVATAVSTTAINVSWQLNATNYSGFNLYRSPNGINGWQQITSTAQNVFSYSDQGLTPATTYWYKVAAYSNSGGEGGFSNIDSATTFAGTCTSAISVSNTDSAYVFTVTSSGTGPYTYMWSKNGVAFNGADAPVLVLSGAGSYTVCVTVTDANNCVATDCKTVVINSLSELTVKQVEFYPNPVTDKLFIGIEATISAPVEIKVFDLTGREVLRTERTVTSGKNLLNIQTADLTSGTYQVVLKSGNEKWRGRIVKGL